MTILLRIYFVGLIAFLPGEADRDLTILLLDVRDGYVASDGTKIEAHKPLLLARAGHCEGDCTADQEPLAEFLYRGLLREGHGEPMELLHQAIHEGGAWELDDSDLAIVPAAPAQRSGRESLRILRDTRKTHAAVPQSSEEREDFHWVADIGRIAPGAGEIDPDVLAEHPRKGLIAGRLRLSEGRVRTHRLVRVGDEVRAIGFKTLRGDFPKTDYSQALAEWIVAEVSLPGCKVKLVDTDFTDLTGGRRPRDMELSDPECEEKEEAGVEEEIVIEVAILNVPQSSFQPVRRPPELHERIGRHFETYYELSRCRPPNKLRPVPYVVEAAAGVAWLQVYPEEEELSDFLAAIVPPPGKGLLIPQLCPVALFSPSDS